MRYIGERDAGQRLTNECIQLTRGGHLHEVRCATGDVGTPPVDGHDQEDLWCGEVLLLVERGSMD